MKKDMGKIFDNVIKLHDELVHRTTNLSKNGWINKFQRWRINRTSKKTIAKLQKILDNVYKVDRGILFDFFDFVYKTRNIPAMAQYRLLYTPLSIRHIELKDNVAGVSKYKNQIIKVFEVFIKARRDSRFEFIKVSVSNGWIQIDRLTKEQVNLNNWYIFNCSSTYTTYGNLYNNMVDGEESDAHFIVEVMKKYIYYYLSNIWL